MDSESLKSIIENNNMLMAIVLLVIVIVIYWVYFRNKEGAENKSCAGVWDSCAGNMGVTSTTFFTDYGGMSNKY